MEQLLLLLEQRLQPLFEFGLKHAGKLLQELFHFGNASPRLCQKFQPGVRFHGRTLQPMAQRFNRR